MDTSRAVGLYAGLSPHRGSPDSGFCIPQVGKFGQTEGGDEGMKIVRKVVLALASLAALALAGGAHWRVG